MVCIYKKWQLLLAQDFGNPKNIAAGYLPPIFNLSLIFFAIFTFLNIFKFKFKLFIFTLTILLADGFTQKNTMVFTMFIITDMIQVRALFSSSSHKSSAVLLSLRSAPQTHSHANGTCLHCTPPTNAPTPSKSDYQLSLTLSYALQLCSFPRPSAAALKTVRFLCNKLLRKRFSTD